MNYTQNYHLPQWALNDRIMMDDFNSAMANLENGLTGAQQRDDALSARITTAQTTAEQMPYVTGSYKGTGEQQKITLGFRPRVLFIGMSYATDSAEGAAGTCALFAVSGNFRSVQLDDDGFTLSRYLDMYKYPHVNRSLFTYDYIAFK